MTRGSYDRRVISVEEGAPLPKQTFFNLPESKRLAIIDSAADEFANNHYRSASIARIASRAGIAKGSIYQYFEDKRDIFRYLVDLGVQEKMAALQQTPPEPGMSVFDYLRWLVATGIKAAFSHPRVALLGQVAYRAYYDDLPFHDEVVASMKEQGLRQMDRFVKDAIARGDIDAEINPEMAAFVLSTLSMELGNFIFRRQGIDPQQVGREGLKVIDMKLVEESYEDFIRVLQYGLASRDREG
jgi:AcrR family transcriptional regulator